MYFLVKFDDKSWKKIKFSLFGVKCNSETQMYMTYAAKGLTTPKTDSAR